MSEQATTYVTDEMRGAIGREIGRMVSYPVSASDIRRWAHAVYWPEEPPRRFWDEAYAKTTRFGGITAPEDFNPFAWMVAEEVKPEVELTTNDPDFMEKLLGIPGPGLTHQLNGGMEQEHGVPMRPGDVITSVNRLADYREREGRLGLMLFTVFEDTWTNQDGQVVRTSRSTGIRY